MDTDDDGNSDQLTMARLLDPTLPCTTMIMRLLINEMTRMMVMMASTAAAIREPDPSQSPQSRGQVPDLG